MSQTAAAIIISSGSEEEADLTSGGQSSVIASDSDQSPVTKKKRVALRKRTSTRIKNMASRTPETTMASRTPEATNSEDGVKDESDSDSTVTETAKSASTNSRTDDTETGRTGDECSVCLDPPVHPVQLACSHTFCYLCAKGLVMSDNAACSLCRQPIAPGYLEKREILARVSEDLNDTPPMEAPQDEWQWFYEGRNGWWRFEARTNEDLEETFLSGQMSMDLMIVGTIYIIDFSKMEQYQKERPNRKRKIKRDLKSSDCKGVAGVAKSTWKSGTNL